MPIISTFPVTGGGGGGVPKELLETIDGILTDVSEVKSDLDNYVPTTRTVNGRALSGNITLSASDVGARPYTWMPTASDVGAPTITELNGVKGDLDDLVSEVEATKKSVSDGKTLVANAITGKGVVTATDATFATMASNISSIDTLASGTADATATVAQILTGKTAYVNGAKVTGSMADNGAVSPSALAAGGSYTIPAGYHNGSGKVTAQSLATITSGGTVTSASQILSGYKAYSDGSLYTGTMTNNGAVAPAALNAGGSYTIPAGYHNGSGKVTANSLASQTSGTATAAQILTGQTAWVGGSKITGTMTNQGAKTSSLNAGGSYTIPAGYHNGSGKITANSLSSQTSATATAADILSGKTAWVNGSKLTGTKVVSNSASGSGTFSVTGEMTVSGQYAIKIRSYKELTYSIVAGFKPSTLFIRYKSNSHIYLMYSGGSDYSDYTFDQDVIYVSPINGTGTVDLYKTLQATVTLTSTGATITVKCTSNRNFRNGAYTILPNQTPDDSGQPKTLLNIDWWAM